MERSFHAPDPPFNIDKKLVYEAYKAVKSNGTTGTADQELLLASIKSTPET
jgi:hypothetical protein